MDTTKKQTVISIICFVIILLFLLLIGSGNVSSPFYGDINVIDEGEYGAWISHMLSGQHLYKDIYAAYGPLYIYPFYFFAKLFSPTIFLVRMIYGVFYVFLAVLIFLSILKKLNIPYWIQVITVSLLLIVPDFNMRQGMGLLSIYMMYLAVQNKRLIWYILAGAILAATFLTSSEVGIFSAVIAFGFFVFEAIKSEKRKQFLKKVSSVILSYVAVFILFFLWSSNEGWFYVYISSIYTDLIIYSGIALPNGVNFPNILQLFPHTFSLGKWIKFIVSKELLLYWLLFLYSISFIYIFIRIVFKTVTREDILLLLIAFYGFMLSTILIGRTDHFNFVLSPALIILAFYTKMLTNIYRSAKSRSDRIVALTLLMIFLFFFVRMISIYRPHYKDILVIPSAIAADKNAIPYLGPIAISNKQKQSFMVIQYFVQTHTKQQDTIFFLSNDPVFYLLVDRRNPTSYDIPAVPNTLEKRREVVNDLIIQKPKYIIYDRDSYAENGISNYTRLPEVISYINKYYKKSNLKNYIIYTRNFSR